MNSDFKKIIEKVKNYERVRNGNRNSSRGYLWKPNGKQDATRSIRKPINADEETT